ncbi:MAG TPA: hypothetical protein VGO40_07965 [Longimicrobium sp.]|jgi:hypothetical protein|nr:hypothetical protein [Longimicrobium sp.]
MRSKLTLNLEQLAVDSFQTMAAEKPKGTVFGEQCTCYTNCTCPGCPTCANTCPDTCAGCGSGYSCDGTGCDCSINATRCGGYICP